MWESGWAIRMLQADPALARSTDTEGCTPLHAAASALDEGGISWLLDHGADPNHLVKSRWTPLDLAASGRGWSKGDNRAKFEQVARLLLSRGASLSPIPAVALGEKEWVRARHAEGALADIRSIHIGVNSSILNMGGLLSIAVLHDRPSMLALLLDLGLDPDERIRVDGMDEILFSAGNPLLSCVVLDKRQMAEMLLARGADANANVYTCGSPLFRAYQMKDWEFVRLLEQHGGLLDAVSAGFACQTAAARQLLADEAAGRLRLGAVLPGSTVSEDLLWSACGSGPSLEGARRGRSQSEGACLQARSKHSEERQASGRCDLGWNTCSHSRVGRARRGPFAGWICFSVREADDSPLPGQSLAKVHAAEAGESQYGLGHISGAQENKRYALKESGGRSESGLRPEGPRARGELEGVYKLGHRAEASSAQKTRSRGASKTGTRR